MLAAEASWYASGIAADNHRPSTAYVKTHTAARLAINVEDSVRTALRTRSSSESDGTVPIPASPATQPGSRHVLQRGPRWLTTATISRPLDERSQRSATSDYPKNGRTKALAAGHPLVKGRGCL